MGPGGLEVEVMAARVLDGDKEQQFVHMRTTQGMVCVVEDHSLLVEDVSGKSIVMKARELKRVRGPLPRIYDGGDFQSVDKFEIATDTMPVVELYMAGLPAIAVSYFGEGDPNLNLPAVSKLSQAELTSGLHVQSAPGAPLSTPPSLVAVEGQPKPRALATNPFNDGTPRVPISLLYECTSPVGQRAAGAINNGYGKQPMSLQASSDLQQSKAEAAESLA